MSIPFLDEARELADDAHHGLTRQLEEMREQPQYYSAAYRGEWIADNRWHEDKAAFFKADRDYYLEQAREMFAENLA